VTKYKPVYFSYALNDAQTIRFDNHASCSIVCFVLYNLLICVVISICCKIRSNLLFKTINYSPPVEWKVLRSACLYDSLYVCLFACLLSVCLSVCLSSRISFQISPNFLSVHLICDRGSILVWRHAMYFRFCRWLIIHITEPVGQNQRRHPLVESSSPDGGSGGDACRFRLHLHLTSD